MSSDDTVPVTQQDDFVAEFVKDQMDLSKLKDLTYVVAINTGDRNACKLLASSIRGPYDFHEMIEQVGSMFKHEQHHAKVTILTKDSDAPVMFLDSGTTDYIEAHWESMIFEDILEAACTTPEYVCEAGFINEVKEDDEEELKE